MNSNSQEQRATTGEVLCGGLRHTGCGQHPEGTGARAAASPGKGAQLTGQIRAHDREIERVAKEWYPEGERSHKVKGVGPMTALAFVLTLEDPSRFAKSREVRANMGLMPRLC